MNFKDKYRDVQELVRELMLLRKHNLQFKEGDSQTTLLLFSEGIMTLVILERILRILPGIGANESDTLHNLLEKATSSKRAVLLLPAQDKADAIKKITRVRNTILHGNFEQAAAESGVADVRTYFKTQFAGEIEALYKLTDRLVDQIDASTGQPKSPINRGST